MKTKTPNKRKTKPKKDDFLKKLDIELTNDGFVIWTVDIVKRRKIRHWIIDASCLKKDGQLRMGTPSLYKTEAQIDRIENKVRVIKAK